MKVRRFFPFYHYYYRYCFIEVPLVYYIVCVLQIQDLPLEVWLYHSNQASCVSLPLYLFSPSPSSGGENNPFSISVLNHGYCLFCYMSLGMSPLRNLLSYSVLGSLSFTITISICLSSLHNTHI